MAALQTLAPPFASLNNLQAGQRRSAHGGLFYPDPLVGSLLVGRSSILCYRPKLMSSNAIACVRLDRIGDLLCTLPVSQMAPEDVRVTWFITQGLEFVPLHATPPPRFFSVSRHPGFSQWKIFYRQLKSESFSMIVCFHSPWWVSFTAWLARIPLRVGVRSQWHSYLFLTHGLRQKRSQATKHEMQYNEELFSYALNLKGSRAKPLPSHLPLRASGTSPLSHGYFVVHPGMGGSAENWPSESYRKLIRELVKTDTVVITGTPTDRNYLDELRSEFAEHPQVQWMENKLSPEQLLQVLASARGVIAPSTGVAHLAASLGVKTVGLYPAVQVQSSTRWGIKGPKASPLSPQGGGDMGSISVHQVLKELGL